MFPVGLSTNGKPISEDLFIQYERSGIRYMEISIGKPTVLTFDFDAAAAMAEKHGVTLWSFHLPFMPFEEIDISDPALCGQTIELFADLIRRAAGAGIKIFVVHPSGEPITEQRSLRMATAKESLAKLAGLAAAEGAVIAVEDLPRTCLGHDSDEILELISADERIRVCFDSNHLLHEKNPAFLKKTGHKIITTHISDYDFADEKHWLPGEGKIEWNEVIAALREIGYTGPWLYEIGFKAPGTISRPRDLTCADFAENAKSLFDSYSSAYLP